MEVKQQPNLRFYGVNIIQLKYSFINNITQKNPQIKIDIKPKVFYPEKPVNVFKIIMDVKLEREDNFNLTFQAIGNFEVNQEITQDIKKKFINVNAPAIMFPYIRSFISNFTSSIGTTGTVTIPPQFFSTHLEEFHPEQANS